MKFFVFIFLFVFNVNCSWSSSKSLFSDDDKKEVDKAIARFAGDDVSATQNKIERRRTHLAGHTPRFNNKRNANAITAENVESLRPFRDKNVSSSTPAVRVVVVPPLPLDRLPEEVPPQESRLPRDRSQSMEKNTMKKSPQSPRQQLARALKKSNSLRTLKNALPHSPRSPKSTSAERLEKPSGSVLSPRSKFKALQGFKFPPRKDFSSADETHPKAKGKHRHKGRNFDEQDDLLVVQNPVYGFILKGPLEEQILMNAKPNHPMFLDSSQSYGLNLDNVHKLGDALREHNAEDIGGKVYLAQRLITLLPPLKVKLEKALEEKESTEVIEKLQQKIEGHSKALESLLINIHKKTGVSIEKLRLLPPNERPE